MGYTGKEIALLTDVHGLLEPLEAILIDIKCRGINEIYSLGDNIGDGPNSNEVIKLLELNNVKSIAGNTEEYLMLGVYPFLSYLDNRRIKSCEFTKNSLDNESLDLINKYKHSYIIKMGGKKIGLCHFANDVRIDFDIRSTWSYQNNFDYLNTGIRFNKSASKQFNYANSAAQQNEVLSVLNDHERDKLYKLGYVSYYEEPLFPEYEGSNTGLKVVEFDDIFQGHVHFKLEDINPKTSFHTIRAAGMGYGNDPVDSASYVILKEKEKGFDAYEVLINYDREKMLYTILNSNLDKRIELFTNITDEERLKYKKSR